MSTTGLTDGRTRGDDTSVCIRVLDAVAEADGRSPLSFERRLGDVVDTDALQTLFHDETVRGSITFSFLGYRVQVDEAGRVDVTDPGQ